MQAEKLCGPFWPLFKVGDDLSLLTSLLANPMTGGCLLAPTDVWEFAQDCGEGQACKKMSGEPILGLGMCPAEYLLDVTVISKWAVTPQKKRV